MRSTIKIPVIWGRNRMRGKSEGAMLDDDHAKETVAAVRHLLRTEASAVGVDPTAEFIDKAVGQVLETYGSAYREWMANRNGTVGFVHELNMPSGTTVLMGDERVLSRVSAKQVGAGWVDDAATAQSL